MLSPDGPWMIVEPAAGDSVEVRVAETPFDLEFEARL
jgi:hypothetical protein